MVSEKKVDPSRPGKGSSSGSGRWEEGNPFEGNPFQGKFEFKFDGQKWGWVPVGLAVAVGYMLTRNNTTRHISWQEFRTQYLERGEVDRLQVMNRNVVRVYLRRDAFVTRTPGVSHTPRGAVCALTECT